MAQAGSNDEKNWGSKISLDCPFKQDRYVWCCSSLHTLVLSLPALGEWYMLTQSRSRNSVFSIRPGGSAHPGIKYYYIYVAPWRVKGNVFQIHYSLNLDPAKKLKLFPSCFLILPWNNILSSNSNKKVKSIERYIFQLALCFLNHSSLMLKKKKKKKIMC